MMKSVFRIARPLIARTLSGLGAAGLALACAGLSACGALSIDRGFATNPGAKTMTAATATNETPTTLAINGSVLELVATGTAVAVQCNYDSGGTTNDATTAGTIQFPNSTTTNNDSIAMLFTSSTFLRVTKATLQMKLTGGATGNQVVQIRGSNGTDPTATVEATTAANDVTTYSTGANGAAKDFTLASTVDLAAGNYAVVLKVSGSFSGDASNKVNWATSGATAGCTGLVAYRYSADAGSTWGAGSSGGVRRGFFTLTADTFASSGTASWILTGYQGSKWTLSSFAFAENSGGATGTITYDVGVGSSSTTPTYTDTGLTKAQVQALADKTGAYFYVRANFSTTSSFTFANLGDGSITNQ